MVTDKEPLLPDSYEIANIAEAFQILSIRSWTPLEVAALRYLQTTGQYGDPDHDDVVNGIDALEIETGQLKPMESPRGGMQLSPELAPILTETGAVQRRLLDITTDKDQYTAGLASEMFAQLTNNIGSQGESKGRQREEETILTRVIRQGNHPLEQAVDFLWKMKVASQGPKRRITLRMGAVSWRLKEQPRPRGIGGVNMASVRKAAIFPLMGIDNLSLKVEMERATMYAGSAYSSIPPETLTLTLGLQHPRRSPGSN